MKENINKTQVLWLIRNYLCGLQANKAVKYIEKYFPEINNLDKKDTRKLKKLPDLHEILKQFHKFNDEKTKEKKSDPDDYSQSNKSLKKITIESQLQDNFTTTNKNVTQVNTNKKSKKRKSTEITKENIIVDETNANINNQIEDDENLISISNQNSSSCASIQNRFKRIDESKYKDKLSDERLNDNSYWNMKKYSNNADDFASKAAYELGQVRGKGFRQEKAKKKRCSWKGNGTISTGVSSIQFSDSD
ncbi:SRP40 C-terminal domain-containing [Cryptosporidium sp. chipmunk genotype I]|uniref:SRP40 C-terminal domain-containing n=1 Tax=Cryptosporidium sp. chipmunk genotype I TaxID=1280935 RepID=UPI00351AAC3F|nr:SRP40 C-terminal domain-containing [Cryptosporidium sp. chipmunk genotype I]